MPTSSSVFGSVIGVSSAVTFDVVVVFFGVVLVVLIPCCFLSLSSRFFFLLRLQSADFFIQPCALYTIAARGVLQLVFKLGDIIRQILV